MSRLTASEKILLALADYEYLTAQQVCRLLYAPSSITHVQEKLKSLVDESYVLPLGGRGLNLPRIYTLSGKGRRYAALLGRPSGKRFRPAEEREKEHNLFFMRHSLAVSDVLIAARLLSQTTPGIVLNRMFPERELKRKIYVEVQELTERGSRRGRKICIEPDAALEITIQETYRDFFYVEVYRHLPMESRFKQKVAGYVALSNSLQHQELFQTAALSIAVFAQTAQLEQTLKRWTEEVLALLKQPEEGERFFFSSVDTASDAAEVYLSPVWQHAFGKAPTALLVIEEVDGQ